MKDPAETASSGVTARLIDVVVVADRTPERDALVAALGTRGMLVRAASTAADGLEWILARAPDVVVCDLDLGSWPSVWVFTERLRSGSDTRHVGRILIGSPASPRVEVVRTVDAYVRKPIDVALLPSVVARLAAEGRESRRLENAR